MATSAVLSKIIENQTDLSPKLSKLARYLEKNYQDVAFLGARNLAERAGVSEASVTRLAYACGFSGYGQFQAAIKDEFQKKLSLRKHLPSEEKTLLSEVLSMEREIMDDMEHQLDQVDFIDAVEMMYQAPRVLVVGTHANAMMAEYMAYFMSPVKKDVILIRELNNQSFNCWRSLPTGTVTVAFSFPRYPRQALIITEALKNAGCHIIGLSDSTFSPLAKMSDIHFSVALKYLSYVDPCAAVMALVNALITGLLVRDNDNYKENISQYNEFLTSKDLFLDKEIDIMSLNTPLADIRGKQKKRKRVSGG